jgi:hypothetical protein
VARQGGVGLGWSGRGVSRQSRHDGARLDVFGHVKAVWAGQDWTGSVWSGHGSQGMVGLGSSRHVVASRVEAAKASRVMACLDVSRRVMAVGACQGVATLVMARLDKAVEARQAASRQDESRLDPVCLVLAWQSRHVKTRRS